MIDDSFNKRRQTQIIAEVIEKAFEELDEDAISDGVNINIDITIKPIMPVRFIEIPTIISNEKET